MLLVLRELCDRIAQFPPIYHAATMNSIVTIGPGSVSGRALMQAGDFMASQIESAAVEIKVAGIFSRSAIPYDSALELQRWWRYSDLRCSTNICAFTQIGATRWSGKKKGLEACLKRLARWRNAGYLGWTWEVQMGGG